MVEKRVVAMCLCVCLLVCELFWSRVILKEYMTFGESVACGCVLTGGMSAWTEKWYRKEKEGGEGEGACVCTDVWGEEERGFVGCSVKGGSDVEEGRKGDTHTFTHTHTHTDGNERGSGGGGRRSLLLLFGGDARAD